MNETGIERFFCEAAYFAGLTEWLVEHKDDHEADAEIAKILEDKPFFINVLLDVLKLHQP